MSEREDTESAAAQLMQAGLGALGAGVGAAAGFLVGGPAGAVGGSVSGALLQDALKTVAGDLATRYTSQTEQARMGSVYVLAQSQIMRHLNNGREPRSESFFRPRERKHAKKLRSEAEELLEGTFLAARQSFEERKVQLLANFYTNVVFRNDLDSSHANYILSLLESLTYRQLVMIIIVGKSDLLPTVRRTDFRQQGHLSPLQVGVLFEMYQLVNLGLLVSSDHGYILGVSDINPSKLRLQGTGIELYNVMIPVSLDFSEYGFFVNAFLPPEITEMQNGQTSPNPNRPTDV